MSKRKHGNRAFEGVPRSKRAPKFQDAVFRESSALNTASREKRFVKGTRKIPLNITTYGRDGQAKGDFEMPPELLSGGPSPAMDFMNALGRGDPRAERIIESIEKQYEQSAKEEPSLADQFVASTYMLPKKWGLTKNEAKKIEPILASYRNDMRRAHRFVLDDDFTKLATEVSSTMPPEKLLARLQYATLPYDVTWIEFNLRARVRTMRTLHKKDDSKFNYSEVAPRLGCILHRLSDTEALCELAVESISDEQTFLGTVICYYFSTRDDYEWKGKEGWDFGCMPLIEDAHIWKENFHGKVGLSKSAFDKIKHDRHLVELAAASLWGYSAGGESTILEKASDIKKLRLPSFLHRHGVLGYGRMYWMAASLPGFKSERGISEIASLFGHEIGEFTGMVRWIVTILGMLNEVPIDAKHVRPSGHVRTGLTNRRPMMDYRKVTLRLPKTDPIKFVERQFRAASRRRAHEVRSHWRTYLNDPHCAIDQHEWEYDHDEGYRLCGKCMSFGRRIPEHIRGDATLGWVRHDYVIKPS